jgi:hypothetical protein
VRYIESLTTAFDQLLSSRPKHHQIQVCSTMAEAECAGGVQNDMEKELTCSVSERTARSWLCGVVLRRWGLCPRRRHCSMRHRRGTLRTRSRWVMESLIWPYTPGSLLPHVLRAEKRRWDAPANHDMRRSAPTCSTSRSRSSTVCTHSAAHVSRNGSPSKHRRPRPYTRTPAPHAVPRYGRRSQTPSLPRSSTTM